MASTKVSNYDRATIVEWYDNGWYSQRELADIYGVSRATIRRVIEDDRNFCGRADRPTVGYAGQPEEEQLGLPFDELGVCQSEDGPPPWWLPVGLLLVTLVAAGYAGWVIYNAAH